MLKIGKRGMIISTLILIISFFIVATLGIFSMVVFGLDVFHGDVEQKIIEKEYNLESKENFLGFLQGKSGYFDYTNLDLVLLNLNKKLDNVFVENEIRENLKLKDCWILYVKEAQEKNPATLATFVKKDCGSTDKVALGYMDKAIKVDITNFETPLKLVFFNMDLIKKERLRAVYN